MFIIDVIEPAVVLLGLVSAGHQIVTAPSYKISNGACRVYRLRQGVGRVDRHVRESARAETSWAGSSCVQHTWHVAAVLGTHGAPADTAHKAEFEHRDYLALWERERVHEGLLGGVREAETPHVDERAGAKLYGRGWGKGAGVGESKVLENGEPRELYKFVGEAHVQELMVYEGDIMRDVEQGALVLRNFYL
ncbi:hypothetical protein B0T22DRAFT_489122 [Podospora appendiculata]|uniref:Uncharacterized protein n=1 Tax=Podospora appendiculata TaxID=314037 RepID=A0AAE1CB82_9PEZI|nr:hypothetical protein B0T22DRAFT_489122 [Podospora appendiculata]